MKKRLQRAEAEGFIAGVRWAAYHMEVAAGRIQNPGAAKQLMEAARELDAAGKERANELWPPFDPLPPASKGLTGPG